MDTRLSDSAQYRHLWSTPELTEVFAERARLAAWLRILGALARAQARCGVIPSSAAAAIDALDADRLDLDRVAAETRATGHSTLGLIRALEPLLPPHAYQYVYYGVTVQDVTDTWFGLVLRDVGAVLHRRLDALGDLLAALALTHRDTPMVGRTHGQPGAPITFGYKAAGWLDEVDRHVERLTDGRGRWEVAQLGGAVGALGFFGEAALPLRAAFCAEVGLGRPRISWLTARDRLAEFGAVLAMVATTLARIGNEVYELARPEIGELREARRTGTVGSITMPHKRNPEVSEHLDTLARLVRSHAAILVEGMAGSHERDGRSWKAEWIALPEVCLLTDTAASLAVEMVGGLEVDAAAMAANITRFGAQPASEALLAGLSATIGKHRAQAELQRLTDAGHGPDLASALVAGGVADPADVLSWTQRSPTASAVEMVDEVVAAHRARRASMGDEGDGGGAASERDKRGMTS